jgi:hypothetical protein
VIAGTSEAEARTRTNGRDRGQRGHVGGRRIAEHAEFARLLVLDRPPWTVKPRRTDNALQSRASPQESRTHRQKSSDHRRTAGPGDLVDYAAGVASHLTDARATQGTACTWFCRPSQVRRSRQSRQVKWLRLPRRAGQFFSGTCVLGCPRSARSAERHEPGEKGSKGGEIGGHRGPTAWRSRSLSTPILLTCPGRESTALAAPPRCTRRPSDVSGSRSPTWRWPGN